MFNVLVADDERLVRESIVKNVDWALLDMRIVAEAEDGLQALSLLEGCEALHVALVDIYMPNMNGLELADALKKRYPQCKIIIITGYDEFEYVRSALRMGVFDYVLKPVTKRELGTLLQEIRYKLEEEERELSSEKHLRRFIAKGQEAQWQEDVGALLSGERQSAPFVVPDGTQWMACALLDPDAMGEDTELNGAESDLVSFVLCNIANEQLGQRGFALRTRQYHCAAVLFSPSPTPGEAREDILPLMQDIKDTLWSAMKLRVSIGIGSFVAQADGLALSHMQARTALDYRFVKGASVTYFGDLAGQEAQPLPQLDALLAALALENEPELFARLHEVMLAIAAQPDASVSRSQSVTLIVLLCRSMDELSPDMFANEPLNVYAVVQNARTLDELEGWIVDTIRRFRAGLRENTGASRHIAQQIKAFIKEQYANSALSFQSLCEALHFSPSYVSMVFRKELKCTFVEYLTRYRMERACDLLKKPEFCSYEVAERVGFSNPHYFSLVFKKITGHTPTQYREKAKEAMYL